MPVRELALYVNVCVREAVVTVVTFDNGLDGSSPADNFACLNRRREGMNLDVVQMVVVNRAGKCLNKILRE